VHVVDDGVNCFPNRSGKAPQPGNQSIVLVIIAVGNSTIMIHTYKLSTSQKKPTCLPQGMLWLSSARYLLLKSFILFQKLFLVDCFDELLLSKLY
jgi:hypothetical protein